MSKRHDKNGCGDENMKDNTVDMMMMTTVAMTGKMWKLSDC